MENEELKISDELENKLKVLLKTFFDMILEDFKEKFISEGLKILDTIKENNEVKYHG